MSRLLLLGARRSLTSSSSTAELSPSSRKASSRVVLELERDDLSPLGRGAAFQR